MKVGEVWMKEAIIQYNDIPSGGYMAIGWIPLVRCKDCEHCYFASNRIPSEQNYACGKYGFDVAPDWFCADGEKAVSE
jgi:hypothetical protein